MHIKWQWMDLMFKTKEDIMFYDYEIVLKLCLTRTSTSLLTMIIQIDCEWILANCRAQRDNQKKMSLNEKGCKILISSKIQLASLMRQEWRNLDQYLNPSSISISVSQSKGGFERWSCGHALLLKRSRGTLALKEDWIFNIEVWLKAEIYLCLWHSFGSQLEYLLMRQTDPVRHYH